MEGIMVVLGCVFLGWLVFGAWKELRVVDKRDKKTNSEKSESDQLLPQRLEIGKSTE